MLDTGDILSIRARTCRGTREAFRRKYNPDAEVTVDNLEPECILDKLLRPAGRQIVILKIIVFIIPSYYPSPPLSFHPATLDAIHLPDFDPTSSN